ncbi:MAG: hypothetical protein ABGW69_01980 [Nanoarchaeota archaeon]
MFQRNINLDKYFFYYFSKNNTNYIVFSFNLSNCTITIPQALFIKSLSPCSGLIKTNINNLTFYVFGRNNSLFLNESIAFLRFSYQILTRKLKIGDNTTIEIETNLPGKLIFMIKNTRIEIPLHPGLNKVDLSEYFNLYHFYPFGKFPIIISLCKNEYCKEFADYLYFEESPVYCEIKTIENNFPYYLKFKITIKNQKNESHFPLKLKYSSPLYIYDSGSYYVVYFPKFYPSGLFPVYVKADTISCKKFFNLTYKNYFYAYSSPLDKKLNITTVYLENPYKEKVSILLKYKNETINVSLNANELKKIKTPFVKIKVIYNNETIYTIIPQVIQKNYFENITTNITKVSFAIILFLILFNIIIFLISKEEELKDELEEEIENEINKSNKNNNSKETQEKDSKKSKN